VYAGTDPLTGRALRHRQTVKTEEQARIVLGKLLERASAGQPPEFGITVRELLARHLEVAEFDVSTRETYEGYIRRTILPALGAIELRKLRGPVLDTFYARLRRCSNLACTGRPFTDHYHFPELTINPDNDRPAWRQAADAIRVAIISGQLTRGEQLPSVRDVAARHSIRVATLRRALATLAAEGLITLHRGRRAVVCWEQGTSSARSAGAFAAAVRWEWIDRNPAKSARLPKARPRSPASPAPSAVAAVISAARRQQLDQLALYVWLAAITGARRGELCGLQWADIDLKAGVLHVAFSYLVRAGQRVRKDTKTHQDRHLALDPVTCAMLAEARKEAEARLAAVGIALPPTAYVFSADPLGGAPWNPDWVSHKVAELAKSSGVILNIKALRAYTASQLLAGGIDLRNTAARLGHGSGGATTLRHYADPVSEVDRRAAAYLAQLTAPATLPDR
jgi:integrase